jgi:hypothetical protein
VPQPSSERSVRHRDAKRAFLPPAKQVLSTTRAAEELGANVLGMKPWSHVDVNRPDGGNVNVTAVHAQHGPDGNDAIQGPVLGFLALHARL